MGHGGTSTRGWRWLLSTGTLMAVVALGATGAFAQSKIGTASTIRNQVDGIIAGGTRALSSGSEVFQDERVRTGEESQAQLVFLDATNLSVGPRSEVRLDRFVYNPDRGTGRVVVNAGRGVFRFVTGSQNPNNYTVKTPIATIGVRGTDFHLLVDRDRITVALVSGLLRIVTNHGRVVSLTPGMAVTIFANGRIDGPTPWSGPITRYAGNVPFPYFGTELSVAGLPPFIPLPAVPTGATNWTGAYVGGSAGYGSAPSGNTYITTVALPGIAGALTAPPPPPGMTFATGDTARLQNAIGSAQAGFNLQLANVVIGLETDAAAGSLSAGNALATCPPANCATSVFRAYNERIEWFGTTRGRAGLAFGPVLMYATGGVAYAQIRTDSATTVMIAGASPTVGSFSTTKTGWAAGGGLEVAIIGPLSWKAEYLHIDFGTLASSNTFPPLGPLAATIVANRLTMDTVRTGLNVRF